MSEEIKNEKAVAHKNVKVGLVISKSGDKSVVIKVDRLMRHAKFRRVVKRSKKYMVHDEKNACKVGDKVEIIESRPISSRKRWRFVRIIESGK
jgi:small subunit ribosomal protein S17